MMRATRHSAGKADSSSETASVSPAEDATAATIGEGSIAAHAAFRRSIARTLDAVRTGRYERTLAPSSSLANSCAQSELIETLPRVTRNVRRPCGGPVHIVHHTCTLNAASRSPYLAVGDCPPVKCAKRPNTHRWEPFFPSQVRQVRSRRGVEPQEP